MYLADSCSSQKYVKLTIDKMEKQDMYVIVCVCLSLYLMN